MLYLYAYNLISALFKMKFVVRSDGWLCSKRVYGFSATPMNLKYFFQNYAPN